MKICPFVVAVVAVGSTVAAAQQIVSRDRTIQTVAHAGKELRVQNYASYDRDCQPLPVPQITIRRPPTHGTVSIRPGVSTISVIREGSVNCAGHQYPATTVWYMPTAGYAGPDQFDFDIVSTRTTAHDTVTVDVQQ